MWKKSKLRERKLGYLFFGMEPNERWMISDPESDKLVEAMHATRYGTPTQSQLYTVLSAAKAYIHLTTYPLKSVSRVHFDDIRRALNEHEQTGN
jgi:hypothetical protein